ncbi:MAG: phosphatidylglycerophosphatase A [Rickettsiales bacterium]|nr:phosphatidylglycerophosphatase A [Rickettsiales bacterium]
MSKFHEWVLTFFYFGNVKKAPGTVGSALAVALWFFITSLFMASGVSLVLQTFFWLSFCAIFFNYGIFAAPIYTKSRHLKKVDHQSIIIDEVVGQIIALQISYLYLFEDFFSSVSITIYHLVASFLIFRFFDIYKPSVIGLIDKKLDNGLGVMLDDVLSGFVAGWLVILGWWIVL